MGINNTIYALSCELKEVPHHYEWLHVSEKEVLSNLRFTKRRNDWLLGRWTVKQLLNELLPKDVGIQEICVIAADDGAPEVFVRGNKSNISISISHSHGRSYCIATKSSMAIGCDLEKVETRTNNFIKDYYTDAERMFLYGLDIDLKRIYANVIWCTKEAVMKAIRQGLRRDTKSINASFHKGGQWKNWHPVQVQDLVDKMIYPAYFRLDKDYVMLIACSDKQFDENSICTIGNHT
jgi:phosphopantetheinyl transferase